jgi:hypothetical protein
VKRQKIALNVHLIQFHSDPNYSLQSELFNEAEFESVLEPEIEDTADGGVNIQAHTRKRGGSKALPAELPRIEVIYDLSDDEKVCDQGHVLKQISEKTSEQLDIIPMKNKLEQTRGQISL